MKLLVFGQTGQVARELARRLPQAQFLGRNDANLTNPTACAQIIAQTQAHAVINAAAWTAVDKAEAEETAATLVNGHAPTAMARAAADRGLPFLHISTDYVFNGQGTRAFAPTDPTAPLNAYGRSKLVGEIGIRAANGPHLILRTSWIVSAHGTNFIKTMLRLGAERPALSIVADQIGAPTPAAAIADALIIAARALHDGTPGGTHHFAGTPDTSWADFARAIMAGAHLACQITDIPTTAYPTPARRPLNSRLDCSTFTATFGVPRPDWRQGLNAILKELTT